MAYYKNLKSLLAAVQKDIEDTMAKDVYSDVVNVMREEIRSEVYDPYSPTTYDRRGDDGGLSDRVNFEPRFSTISGGLLMEIYNTAKGSEDDYMLTPLIIGGDGYGGYAYNYPYKNRDPQIYKYLAPRNFVSSTRNRLLRSLEHVDSFKRGMIKRGYKLR